MIRPFCTTDGTVTPWGSVKNGPERGRKHGVLRTPLGNTTKSAAASSENKLQARCHAARRPSSMH